MVRGLMVGLFSLVAFVAFASSASALTSSTGSITGTAGGTTLTITTAGGPINATCASSSVAGTITNTASGVSTAPVAIPLGRAAFNTCRLAGTNLTVTQTSAWTGVVTGLGNPVTGATLAITVPAAGVSFSSANGCRFTVSGTRTSNLVAANPFSSIPFTAGSSTLRVDSATGCSPIPGIAVGNTANFLATYTISPAVTLTA
jgi:hypothetical protein